MSVYCAGGNVGLKDFVTGQLIEIIEWVDDSRDTGPLGPMRRMGYKTR